MTELILGTAQFGAGYGITNSAGRLDDRTVAEILGVAAAAGIELFDTAPDYGDAQSRIREMRPAESVGRYVSKFGLPPVGSVISGDELIGRTLSDLGIERLYGLLFHRVADIRDDRAIEAWDTLRSARASGAIARIGASIYDETDLLIVMERFPDLDLLQIPGNLLDRRLLDHPGIAELHERGVEIHVRSAYLQGLLLATPDDIPDYFSELRPVLRNLRNLAEQSQQTMIGLALGFLTNHEVVDAVLVGAAAPAELESTVRAWNVSAGAQPEVVIARIDDRLLDPRTWPQLSRQ